MAKYFEKVPAFKRILQSVKKKLSQSILIIILSAIFEGVFATNNEIFASVAMTFIVEILYINLYSTPNKLRLKQHIINKISKLNNESTDDGSRYFFNDNLFDLVSNYQDSIIRLMFYSTMNMPLIICSSIEKIWNPLFQSADLRVLFCLFGMVIMCLICVGYATNFESKILNQILSYRKSHVNERIHELFGEDDIFIGEYSDKELEILDGISKYVG